MPAVAQTNGTDFLQNAAGLVVDVPSSSTADVQLQQYSLNRSLDQQWALANAAAAGYKTLTGKNAGKVMVIGGAAVGAAVLQRTGNRSFDGQQWRLLDVGGYYKLENKSNDLPISGTANGSATANRLVVKAYAGTNDQKWQLVSVSTSGGTSPSTTTPQPTSGYTACVNYGAHPGQLQKRNQEPPVCRHAHKNQLLPALQHQHRHGPGHGVSRQKARPV